MNLRPILQETKKESSEPSLSLKKLSKTIYLAPDGRAFVKSHLNQKNVFWHAKSTAFPDQKELESDIIGWTGQKKDLKEFILSLISKNQIADSKLIAAFQHEKIQIPLFDLLFYAKQILVTASLKEKNQYIEAFSQAYHQFAELAGKDTISTYFQSCEAEKNLCRFIPLASFSIKHLQSHLEDFNLSETMAHRIAYAIAKHPDQVKKIVLQDNNQQVINSFTVDEIRITKSDKQRDLGLMGAILVPERLEEKNSLATLHVIWAGTHSTHSAKIDSEICPGEESYRRGEDQVLKQIIPKIEMLYKHSRKPVNVILSGHSLGGALAQLTFHSLQRILMFDIKDSQINREWEIEFQKQLKIETADIEHQRSLSGISLSRAYLHSITVEAWNSPGVLAAVAKHSNLMSGLLAEKGIKLFANYGMVHGDPVQTSGHGMVLNEVGKNKARIRILKIQPNQLDFKTKSIAGVSALSVGKVLGTAILGGPAGAMATAVTLSGATYVSLGKLTADAHRMHHFRESKTPQHEYDLLTSHTMDGSLNHANNGCAAIQKELDCKSVVLNKGFQMMSLFSTNQARTETLREKEEEKFNKALKKIETKESAAQLLKFFIREMKTHEDKASGRILKTIDEKKFAINETDDIGKSLLHHAIEKNCLILVTQLLTKKTDVNLQDKEGNTPLISLLTAKSINYEIGLKLLAHADINVFLSNQKGISAQTVHDSWYSYGAPGTQAREFSLKLKEKLGERVVAKISL